VALAGRDAMGRQPAASGRPPGWAGRPVWSSIKKQG